MDRRQFIDRLKVVGMERAALAVEQVAPTRVKVDIFPTEETEIPLRQSRFGGLPDLPPETEWPIWNGKPLSFLMQLNLSDISHYSVCEPLPKSGWLYFFYYTEVPIDTDESPPWGYDPKHKDAWRVFFFQGPSDALVRRPLLPGSRPWKLFRTCRLSFREDVSTDWPDEALDELDLDEAEEEQYRSYLDNTVDEKEHQILGNSSWVQIEPDRQQRRCQFVSNGIYMGGGGGPDYSDEELLKIAKARKELEPGADDWRLLAQIDSDKELGINWGQDYGRIFFWIRGEDLKRRDFSKVWMVLDCM